MKKTSFVLAGIILLIATVGFRSYAVEPSPQPAPSQTRTSTLTLDQVREFLPTWTTTKKGKTEQWTIGIPQGFTLVATAQSIHYTTNNGWTYTRLTDGVVWAWKGPVAMIMRVKDSSAILVPSDWWTEEFCLRITEAQEAKMQITRVVILPLLCK